MPVRIDQVPCLAPRPVRPCVWVWLGLLALCLLAGAGSSHYRMVIKAPDGANMIWHLRTELDAGPLALLKLRGFRLPQQIFLAEGGAPRKK
ncbi:MULTISPECIES: hypothetical protein [Pseudomonas]|uniref:hypothetical protein n=1 Tax=Pseudomonas TaxID=286 RepID=UPI001BE9DD68|nr:MULTISPECIES: hypothetical protein [Pseudomonas]MBT2342099.1 hypothetical protein [Pseudomonas fluorescens]MCD4528709.1 hypothetical protein [Pseudomonas sp. C3-2018]